MAISLRKFHFTKLSVLLFVGFLSSISVSLLNGVWSLYFDSFFHNNSLVGYFSTILSVAALILFFVFTPIVEKYQEKKIYFYALFVSIILLLSFSLVKNFNLFVLLVVVYVMMGVLRAETFGIMVRGESKTRNIGKNEGLNFTLSNLGWVIGAVLIIALLKVFDIPDIFVFAAIFLFISFVTFYLYNHKVKKSKDIKFELFNDLKNFFKNKELRRLYISSMGLSMWLGVVLVYTPLYIVQNGFDKSFVGVFLFTFLAPFLLQSIIGKKSDSIGSKFFIILGYLIIGSFVSLIFFADHIVYVLLLLVLSGFGASFVEATKEIHFFKTTKKKEEEHYYGIYLTHMELGLILGKVIPAFLLGFLSFKHVFSIMGLIIFLFLFLSLRLKNI